MESPEHVPTPPSPEIAQKIGATDDGRVVHYIDMPGPNGPLRAQLIYTPDEAANMAILFARAAKVAKQAADAKQVRPTIVMPTRNGIVRPKR
jgi:hypothetical protein